MAALDPGSAEAPRPNRLGSAYAKLWTAASVSYLGDGIYDTALPLLAARLTRDPLVVASVVVAGQLPWLLFALPGGALVDRWDRRRVLWVVDAYRGVIAGSLAAAIVAGWASIPLLGAAGFLLAVGGTLFNPASMSVVPALVCREPSQLERANGRLAAAQTVGGHFLGPSAGGLLFSVSRAVPFLVDAVSFVVSSALIASIPGRFAPGAGPAGGTARRGGGLRAEIAEGLRWLAAHRLLRTLAAMNAVTSLGFSAWSSIMVLFAQDLLGLGSVGFGLLWTGVAAGSLLGSLLSARLSRAAGQGRLLVGSAVVFGLATLGIGTSGSPWLAGALLGILGLALTMWNVVVVSLRQAIAPDRLAGRVNSAFQLLTLGMLPVGAAAGGALGRALGLRAPFLVTGTVLLAMAAIAAPKLTTAAIAAARDAAE